MTSDLARLLQDPRRVAEIPPDQVPMLLAELERVRADLWRRMISASATQNGQPAVRAEDRLLDVEEAAQKLGVSKDWLYRRADKLPFTIRVSAARLRFSEQGIERWIRQREGR
jgi:predicted DNA-binding transcriptional regulator AlpA